MDRKRAFERLAMSHTKGLYRLALRLCRNDADAQDLVQDAMVKAYRFFHRFESGSNERAWLYKITVNLFYNRYHQQMRLREVADEAFQGDHLDRFVSDASRIPTQDPEQALLNRLSAAELCAAFDRLPTEFRAALILSDVEGFSYREIADIVGCPIGTVMSRIFRGRRLLRAFLQTQPASDKTLDLDEYRRKRQEGV